MNPVFTTDNGAGLSGDMPVVSPKQFNFGYDVIDRWAEFDRNKLAMIWTNQKQEERRYTFRDLKKLSNQAANLLLKYGISHGDRVFIMLPRLPEWWIFSLALIKLGAIQCPSPTLLMPQDIQYRIRAGKFKMVITDADNAAKFDAVYNLCPTLNLRLLIDGNRPGWIDYQSEIHRPPQLSPHAVKTPFPIRTQSCDPMLLVFTSGTSKSPKMVLHSYDYPLGHRVTGEFWHDLTPNDLHFTVSDTGWAKNMWGNYFGQWIAGSCIFVYDVRGKFHAEELLPLLERYGVTSFCAPPTVYRMLILNDLSKFDFRELRTCTAAGEPLHTETVKIWQESTGLTIRQGYGQTESVCMIATPSTVRNQPGAMGIASPGWEIELHDENGRPVKQGEEGRIAVKISENRPVGLFRCYLDNDEENARSFIDGFYYTGDKAYQDQNGYYWFVGRSDDIIKSSGYRIGPSEVEDVLTLHPAVHEAAVVGAPDPLRGTKVKAYIVLHQGVTATESLVKELQNHVKKLTAPYKYPREIEFVDRLPKTFSGKIMRSALRHHAETGEKTW